MHLRDTDGPGPVVISSNVSIKTGGSSTAEQIDVNSGIYCMD